MAEIKGHVVRAIGFSHFSIVKSLEVKASAKIAKPTGRKSDSAANPGRRVLAKFAWFKSLTSLARREPGHGREQEKQVRQLNYNIGKSSPTNSTNLTSMARQAANKMAQTLNC